MFNSPMLLEVMGSQGLGFCHCTLEKNRIPAVHCGLGQTGKESDQTPANAECHYEENL